MRGCHLRAVAWRPDGGEHRAVRLRQGVLRADRPELFPKSPAWRVVTDGEPIGIRADSGHDVPEPELAVVANSRGEIVGFTVCNDVSSRSIEGENPLYIPQAKVFAGGCALATGIRPAWEVGEPQEPDHRPGDPPRRRRGLHRHDLDETAGPRAAGPDRRAVRCPTSSRTASSSRPAPGSCPSWTSRWPRATWSTISISEVGTLTNTVAVGREPFAFLAAADPGGEAMIPDTTPAELEQALGRRGGGRPAAGRLGARRPGRVDPCGRRCAGRGRGRAGTDRDAGVVAAGGPAAR